ncbi:MAG: hypothetical protein SFW36_06250 [Leptolyngbyaceae cyanobacterium bins.59]|nr:hypothetical protein [Leptolyngbyaceae cyanobacterium bins.59]
MLKSLSRLPIVLWALAALPLTPLMPKAIAQTPLLQQDYLDTVDGKPWGAPSWPYNTVVGIEMFGGGMVGRAVLDRDGQVEPIDGYFIKNPLGQIKPVSTVVITAWSSKTDGCYMDMLVQYAPSPSLGEISLDTALPYLVPRDVQIAVGYQQVLTLVPQKLEGRSWIAGPYRYEYYHTGQKQNYRALWYMARSVYTVKPEQAAMLSSAKPGNVRARITFTKGSAYQYDIGEGTVTRWKEVFNYNPSCRPGGAGKPAIPVVGTASGSTPSGSSNRPAPSLQGVEVNAYPSNADFNTFDRTLRTILAKKEPGTGVRLTPATRKARQAYRNQWQKENPPIARFLGAWYTGERAFYVYPSAQRGRACVVAESGGVQDFYVGTALNKEMRYGGTAGFYWVDQEHILAARDRGGAALYPIYAMQNIPTLTPQVLEAMEKAKCNTTLP